MDNPRRTHWVLLGPSEKQAGRRDQRKIANQWRANDLTDTGQGGGIVSLLLPRTPKERATLQRLRGRYRLKEVPTRAKRDERDRLALQSDELMLKLARLFEEENGSNRRAMHAIVREFSRWVCKKLSDPCQNEVRQLIGRHDMKWKSDLANKIKPDWWRKQIAARRKNIKK